MEEHTPETPLPEKDIKGAWKKPHPNKRKEKPAIPVSFVATSNGNKGTVGKAIIKPRDSELLKVLGKHLVFALQTEHMPQYAITALTGMPSTTIKKIRKGESAYSIVYLLRCFDALGYELVPVKRTDKMNIWRDPKVKRVIQKQLKTLIATHRKSRAKRLKLTDRAVNVHLTELSRKSAKQTDIDIIKKENDIFND